MLGHPPFTGVTAGSIPPSDANFQARLDSDRKTSQMSDVEIFRLILIRSCNAKAYAIDAGFTQYHDLHVSS